MLALVGRQRHDRRGHAQVGLSSSSWRVTVTSTDALPRLSVHAACGSVGRARAGSGPLAGSTPELLRWSPRRASWRSRSRLSTAKPPRARIVSSRLSCQRASTARLASDAPERVARTGRAPARALLDPACRRVAPLGERPRVAPRLPMSDSQQRYRVIEKLESGGMAEVFRAESEGLQGFRKQVAIKRVLPHLSSKKKFISMFLDEARLSAQLSHSNCVQVFDIGVGDNAYLHRHGVRRRGEPQGDHRAHQEERTGLPGRGRGLHLPRDLQGPRLRARAHGQQRRRRCTSSTATCRRRTCSSRSTAR